MNEKTLVLFKASNVYYFNNLNLPNIDVRSVFQDDMGTKYFGCKIARRLNSSLTRLYYTDWYKKKRQICGYSMRVME